MSYPPCHNCANMKTKNESSITIATPIASVLLPTITSQQLTANRTSAISQSQPTTGRNIMPPKIEKAEKAAPEKAAPMRDGKTTATRDRELEAAISSITKAYGEGSIMRLGD